MKELVLNWRVAVLAVLSALCLICMVSEPAENTNWLLVLCLSKVAGIAFGYASYKLFTYWDKRNQLPDIFKEV